MHIAEPDNKNAVSIAQNANKEAKSKNKNVIIIDTAGRLAVDEVMMTEVADIKNAVKPQEIAFCGGFDDGSGDAVNTAKAFTMTGWIYGVVLTKTQTET